MTRLFIFIGIAVFCVGTVNAVITEIQHKAANTAGTAATSLTITMDANATVGNTLVLALSAGQFPTRIKYGSNTDMFWSTRATGAIVAVIGYTHVVEASPTIVITLNGTVHCAAVVTEYSGTLITSDIPPLSATGSSVTNTTGTLASTGYANELIVASMVTSFATTTNQTAWLTSPTNSFSSVAQTSSSINTTADREVAFLERIVTSTGTYQTQGTQANNAWANLIASFTDNPTPTPTATATPTSTPTATATATPSATATSTPTPTPTPPIETSHSFGG